MFFFFFRWDISHPLSTYKLAEWRGVIQNVYRCGQGEGIKKSVIRYVCTKWMAHSKYTRVSPPARKMSITSTKKQAFDFLKTISYANVCLKYLCDTKRITPPFIFLISSKKLKWKQHFHTDAFWSYLLFNMAVLWGEILRRGWGRAKWTDEQLSDKRPFIIRCGEIYSACQQ